LIDSPCIKVCVMNDAIGLCRGCYRTLDEIARWSQMTDEERLQVIESTVRRKSAHPEDAGAQSRRLPGA
jgi:predicted Fe-S protein YdhL (DUF1289 family)